MHHVSSQPHTAGGALFYREKVSFPLTFCQIIKAIFLSQGFWSCVFAHAGFSFVSGLCFSLAPGEAGAFPFLAGWCSLLGLPCSHCLQVRRFFGPLWLMNASLPALPFLIFLIMSALFGGLGHCLLSEHSLMFSSINTILICLILNQLWALGSS